MISAELLKRIDDYFDVHYLDLEWLEQKKKAGWHFYPIKFFCGLAKGGRLFYYALNVAKRKENV